MKLYAVIPTRDRHDTLLAMVEKLLDDQVETIVVDNGSTPPISFIHPGVHLIRDEQQPPNLSRLWNLGLREATRDFHRWELQQPDYAVAVLNDDLILPPRFVQTLAEAMQRYHAAAAYPDQHGWGADALHTTPGPVDLRSRMCGYAFLLRGAARLYADETLQWWYGDDDLDWRARQAGGSLLVAGTAVQHLHPNESTNTNPVLSAQAGLDRATFTQKWGQPPW